MRYNLNLPSLSILEKKYVIDVIKGGWLSSNGKHTKIFEEKFSSFLEKKYSLAVQSGTSALHVALKGLDIKDGDKVIIPNYTCVSNISAVSQCNAIPVIVEVERDTLGLDYNLVEKAIIKHRPKVLQLVHVYGFPARDTIKIINLCKKKNIKIIEDASESLGAKIKKKYVGSLGDVAIFSLRSEKMIGVGEGGVITTSDNRIFKKIKLLASRNAPFRSAYDPYWKKYYHKGEGYNYLMPHMLGALARAQIERFKKEILKKKVIVGRNYRKLLDDSRIEFTQKILKDSTSVFWLNSIYFKESSKEDVRRIGSLLMKKGIEVRSGFWPLNLLKSFKSLYVHNKEFNSKEIFEKSLVLPSSYNLSMKDIKNIYKILLNILDR